MFDPEPHHDVPKSSTPTWRAGLFVLTYVSGWLLVPIVALLVGMWLDQRFGTWPWLALGLALGTLVVVSMAAIKYVKKITK